MKKDEDEEVKKKCDKRIKNEREQEIKSVGPTGSIIARPKRVCKAGHFWKDYRDVAHSTAASNLCRTDVHAEKTNRFLSSHFCAFVVRVERRAWQDRCWL